MQRFCREFVVVVHIVGLHFLDFAYTACLSNELLIIRLTQFLAWVRGWLVLQASTLGLENWVRNRSCSRHFQWVHWAGIIFGARNSLVHKNICVKNSLYHVWLRAVRRSSILHLEVFESLSVVHWLARFATINFRFLCRWLLWESFALKEVVLLEAEVKRIFDVVVVLNIYLVLAFIPLQLLRRVSLHHSDQSENLWSLYLFRIKIVSFGNVKMRDNIIRRLRLQHLWINWDLMVVQLRLISFEVVN